MSDEHSTSMGRKRKPGPASTLRSEALERLKTLRSGGRLEHGSIQVKIEKPIFDVVDDEEYEAHVAQRREEVKGFIVDDDGLGYCDEGQEEDWSVAGGSFFSEESEGESERSKRKKDKQSVKKPSPLASAAALMGKQRISSMFTSSVFKKDTVQKNLSLESIVNGVIAEFAPDENDRKMSRRGKFTNLNWNDVNSSNANLAKLGGLPLKNENPVKSESRVVRDKEEIKEVSGVIIEKGIENKEGFLNEVKMNAEDMEKKVFSLNAKVEEAKDQFSNATVEWQAVTSSADGTYQSSINLEKLEFEVDSDGSLPFHILDAHEVISGANAGTLYLFGKVKSGATYNSCCAVVRNMQRCIYAIPSVPLMPNNTIMELEKNVEESRRSLTAFKKSVAKQGKDVEKSRTLSTDYKDTMAKLEKNVEVSKTALLTGLEELASKLKTEITKELTELTGRNISSFSMKPVKRNYAFERSDIPHGENYSLKINYPFKYLPLPQDLKGKSFCALLGTQTSGLELFLVKRKIKGPSWLSIKNFSSLTNSQRVSWCKFEVAVDFPKDIKVSTSREIPPVVVTSINLKTIVNEKLNVNEIVSASVICCHKAKIDVPMLDSEWEPTASHFTVLRKLEEGIFPMGFTKEVDEKNSRAWSKVICYESSERALLGRLMAELHKLDSDVLVGHNISGVDLDVFLKRVKACGVPPSVWSKIGRLKRSAMPIIKGCSVFGLGASPVTMSCLAGRLLCDTYISSRDLLKEVSYSLTQLAKTQFNKDRKEIMPHEIPQMFQSSESLFKLVEYGELDAKLSMKLMFHLSILPLTRQLTNISGNLWHKTLQGARAQRVEYLLLHEFHAKKFIVPDRFSNHVIESRTTKRKTSSGVESKVIDPDHANFNYEPPENNHGITKKGPAYSGGLVLEPKKGLYDKYILLLDFNSLYPTIIQEYNICFTTVDRSSDGIPSLPSSKIPGVLPELLKILVEKRKNVKTWLKKASGLKAKQFDIQQQALKLTANSVYGCLGFSNSRFYAKPLAELITLQGREILQSTVDLVQNTLNLEVVYGDTDSIMIYSGCDDIGKAISIARKVIQEVNKKYRNLEIDIDGLYKRMLLLKKKKYAAVKIMQSNDGTHYEIIERKGLDMVRRDWSLLSKELGDFCLSHILSGGSCEDVVEEIHSSLMKVQEEMRKGQISLEKYVINKTLSKPPEAYTDAKNQPHVEVALRMKRSGYVTGCSAGDTVPYIICCEQGNGSSTSVGIAQRARHPDELKGDNENWIIDIDYYLAHQIHPVISRLCAYIQGTNPARLADCLGLDSSKFQNKLSDSVNNDSTCSLLFALNDEERFKGCEPLLLSCPRCSSTFQCSSIISSVCASINSKLTDAQAELTSSFWQKLHCTKCPEEGDGGRITQAIIANQVKRQAEGFVSTYYKGLMMCDDETCNYTTRIVNLRVLGDAERGTLCPNYPQCSGHLFRKYTEADLYKQLSYYCYILDTTRCIEKIESEKRLLVEREITKIRPLVELAASIVKKMRDRCGYGWVQLQDFVVL